MEAGEARRGLSVRSAGGAGKSTILIASHSPILLGYPEAKIYELVDFGIRRTPYEILEHVAVTRRFVTDRDAYLKTILE